MKILDIAFKDMLRSFRSLFMIGMTIVAPLLIVGLIYLSFDGSGSQGSKPQAMAVLKVAVVKLDVPAENQPALGKMMVEMLNDKSVSSWLKVTEMTDSASARSAVDHQEAGVALIIPQNFSKDLISGNKGSDLVMVQDPTLTIGPMVVKNMVSSFLDGVTGTRIALDVVTKRQAELGTSLDSTAQQSLMSKYQEWFTAFQNTLYNSPDSTLVTKSPTANAQNDKTQTSSIQQIMGLVMVGMLVFFSFYTGATSMMSILNEEEEGTLARLFTTPTSRTLILAGKFLAVFLTVIVQALVLMAISSLAFQINWGTPVSTSLMVVAQVMAASGLGVLLISLMKNARQAGPVLGGGLTVLGMLGGLFTSAVQGMPKGFDTITLFTPHGWVMKGWKIVLSNGSVSDLILPVVVLLVMGAAMFFAGATIFRRRFA